MIKFCNYNIILPKHFEIVKKEGKPAEKIAVQSEGEAEGGCGAPRSRASSLRGKNSASPEPKRSPAALLVESRTQQKSFLFLLEEKIGRAQIRKSEENFIAGWRALASGGGAERQNSQSGFSSKKVRISSNKHHHIELVASLGASPLVSLGVFLPPLFLPTPLQAVAKTRRAKRGGTLKQTQKLLWEIRAIFATIKAS